MARLFGIDGIRDLVNDLLTPTLAVQLGEAAARILTKDASAVRSSRSGCPRVIVDRDTHASGEFLNHATSAGLASSGIDVTHVGVLPALVIAHLTAIQDIKLGVMISASHNPFLDNGIKFIVCGGYKLANATENEVEILLNKANDRPTGADTGRVTKGETVTGQNYINHLAGSVATDLSGLHIVVDAPDGAISIVSPAALRAAGAEVIIINASLDDPSINDNCDSTHSEQLQNYVTAVRADMGMAHDGDTGRCLVMGVDGQLVNGDQTVDMLAIGMKTDGTLGSNMPVVTVMSNLGLILTMREHDIRIVQTGVDDHCVFEQILQGNYTLGNEQSGHAIDTVCATTGDSILTSLYVATRVRYTGKTLAELASVVTRLSQTLANIKNVDKGVVSTNKVVQDAVAPMEEDLGETGQVLLHPSGTEPLVRVTVKAAIQEEADCVAHSLADTVRNNLSL